MVSNSVRSLKNNSDFLALKKNGLRHWPSQWMLLNFQLLEKREIQYGITASRKVGNAVVRNKLKRWCREYFRELGKSDLEYGAVVNVIFKPMQQGFYRGVAHDEITRALNDGLRYLRKKSEERLHRVHGVLSNGNNDSSRR